MLTSRPILCVISIFVVVMIGNLSSLAAEPAVVDANQVLRLTGELVKDYPYILPNELKTRLDDLNRDGREAGEQFKQAERAHNEGDRTKAAQKRDAVAARIVSLLEAWPGLVRIALKPESPVLPAVGPLEFPADQGALLIRTEMGGEAPAKVHAVAQTIDLIGPDTNETPQPIDLPSDGVTFVLAGFTNAPKGRMHDRLDLKAAGTIYRLPLEIRTPKPGHFKLTVLSDETGKPTPAMVRLVWRLNNQTRRVSNAVEIKGQFDSLGRQTSERTLQVPGRARGEYWLMPEPMDMELPAGEWTLVVRHGVEYVPIFEDFKVEPGQSVEKKYTLRRWVDMRKLGWYSGDDHVHCQILDDGDAERLMTYAKAEDVHLVNVVKMGDIFRTWFEQRGFGPQFRVIDGDYTLSPGQECPRTHGQIGHTISMNIKRMVRDTDKYFLYDWVFDQVHAEGGLTGYAHVASGMFTVHRDMTVNIPKGKIDFAEVLQFAHLGTDLWYRFLNAGFKVTGSAGSDIPWGGTMGEVRVFSYLGKEPFSADTWFEAMRRGRTFVSNGPMLEFTVDDALPGDELRVTDNRKLRVKARVWGDPGAVMPAKLEIVRHGEVIKAVEAAAGQNEIKIDMEVDSDHGFWIAAHAVGTNNEQAHTTPVYVVREGLRFWKYDQVDALVGQAMKSLDEIEKLVADAREQDSARKIDDDRTLKQLAAQGPQLLERVADARRIWQDLKAVAQKEGPLRAAK